jgi:hypothetical protein
MIKEEFLQLCKEYCNDTIVLSFITRDHPVYQKLVEAGPDIIPWVLERLKDSIGHDHGDQMDYDNNPWLSTHLLGDLTDGKCFGGMPREYAGRLREVRSYLLSWGQSRGLITP